MRINLFYLYPESMNLYGDNGNILSLVKRCRWRGVDIQVVEVKKGDDPNFNDADIVFMGGGQDRSQQNIADDLRAKGPQIKEAVENDVCVLTICGAYQLFGHYFKTKEGVELPGISVFDAYTVGSDLRMIGNILVDCKDTIVGGESLYESRFLNKQRLELVGFENHSGETYLGKDVRPLGSVKSGYGNDGSSMWEGCRYRNAFGTYLHGPLLPKNPWLTDYLIMLALRRRYGYEVKLQDIDDSIEDKAFTAAKQRALTAKTTHL